MTPLVLLMVAGAVLGFVTRSGWAVAAVAVAAVLYYLGLDGGLWGDGTGDGWRLAMLLATVVTAAVSSAGVVAGRAWRR